MRRALRAALAVILLVIPAAPAAAQQRPPDRPFSFVVLGHLRGNRDDRLNPKLAAVLQRVRALRPDFAVLTGDLIWGDVDRNPSRPDVIEGEWNALDSALGELRIPIYRVPGNHDVSDVHSRDIWLRRYGALPRAVTHGNSRLLLLTSTFFPPDGDTTHHGHIGGVNLDSAQLAFLRRELADTGHAHTFVFLHHNLWWQPASGRWWSDVHPLLAAARVDNVFSGDYGPMKFSTKEADGVRYYQGSMERRDSASNLQRYLRRRLLAAQLDVFFEVRVAGDSAEVIVHPLAVTDGDWTPERHDSIAAPVRLTMGQRIRELLANRRKLAIVTGLGLAAVLAGFAAGWILRGRRAA